VAQAGQIAGPACNTQTSKEVSHALMERLPLARLHGLQQYYLQLDLTHFLGSCPLLVMV
jgi:hypothetical protein